MFCSNCGNQIHLGESFCSKCGRKVETSVNPNTNISVQNSKTGKNNSIAIIAFVLGILGLVVAGLPCGILAVCLGISARNHIKAFPEERGKSLAMAGIIIGIFDIIAVLVLLLVF